MNVEERAVEKFRNLKARGQVEGTSSDYTAIFMDCLNEESEKIKISRSYKE